MVAELPEVTIYTDGSCIPNPGSGGWAAVILPAGGKMYTIRGREEATTNNRMELTAAIFALKDLHEPHRVHVHTDSTYLKDGITRWLTKWRQRQWLTTSGEQVKNRDLWQQLAEQIGCHEVQWSWLKGHGTNEWNILADELASATRQQPQLPIRDPRSVHLFVGITWRQKLKAGAWAGVLQYKNNYKVVGGLESEGSANSLHIQSVLGGLAALKRQVPIHVYTTSGYLREGAVSWLRGWQLRGWQTREGKAVSNSEQWQDLAVLLKRYTVRFHLIDKEMPPCQSQEAKEIAREILASGIAE